VGQTICSSVCAAGLQGWEAARDHARSAVETDNRLRRWLPGPGLAQGPPAGLLYRCTLGNIDLTAPLGARGAVSHPACAALPAAHCSSCCCSLLLVPQSPGALRTTGAQAGSMVPAASCTTSMQGTGCLCTSTAGLLQASREASMGMMECTLTQHQTDAQVRPRFLARSTESVLQPSSLLTAGASHDRHKRL
jgi:hypothetical protein